MVICCNACKRIQHLDAPAFCGQGLRSCAAISQPCRPYLSAGTHCIVYERSEYCRHHVFRLRPLLGYQRGGLLNRTLRRLSWPGSWCEAFWVVAFCLITNGRFTPATMALPHHIKTMKDTLIWAIAACHTSVVAHPCPSSSGISTKTLVSLL
jgi:hypothetical protein